MIIVDSREPERIESKLNKIGILTERKKLDVGDYLFSNIAIERKTMKDFLSSVYDRRLFSQLYDLKNNYDRSLLIVIGSLPKKKWIRTRKLRIPISLNKKEIEKRKKTLLANLAISYLSYNIPFYIAKDEDEFIEFLANLYFKSSKKKISLKPVKKKHNTIKEIKSDMLSCIPFLGRKLANKLSDKFSIKYLIDAPIENLIKIEGIGIKRARKIKEILIK